MGPPDSAVHGEPALRADVVVTGSSPRGPSRDGALPVSPIEHLYIDGHVSGAVGLNALTTAGAIDDDARVVEIVARKHYARSWCGARVTVRTDGTDSNLPT